MKVDDTDAFALLVQASQAHRNDPRRADHAILAGQL
jgi:hypothetical protein